MAVDGGEVASRRQTGRSSAKSAGDCKNPKRALKFEVRDGYREVSGKPCSEDEQLVGDKNDARFRHGFDSRRGFQKVSGAPGNSVRFSARSQKFIISLAGR